MSDFVSGFWHWYVAIGALGSIFACGVFLWIQSRKRVASKNKTELHGNVWDEDLVEYNNPMPMWWMGLFYLTIVFALVYLAFFPGLGQFAGGLGWSSAGQHAAEVKEADAQYGSLFAQYVKVDIPALAKDAKAIDIGQRLFLNECAQCHGSDAGGGKGFPNLRDSDWLYGGDPATLTATISNGRNGVMPALGEAIGGEAGIREMVHYVRSLSGLQHDAALAKQAEPKFAVCAACHGPEGKGNPLLGAPNLTDKVWLYGSSEETIAETIRNGRNNVMPAQGERLGEAKVHLLAAYVYSLGGGTPAPAAAATATAPVAAETPPGKP